MLPKTRRQAKHQARVVRKREDHLAKVIVAQSEIFGLISIWLVASLCLTSCRKPEISVPVQPELHDAGVVAMWEAQDIWFNHQRDGDFYMYVRRFDQARESFEAAVAEAKKSFGKDDPRLARSLTGLGRCFVARRDYPSALLALEESLRIKKAKYRHPSLDVADLLTELAHVRLAQAEVPMARALINESIQLRNEIGKGYFAPETSLVDGMILFREGKQKAAVALYKKVEEALNRELASRKELPPSTRSMTTLRECLDNYVLFLEQSGDKTASQAERKKLTNLNEWLVILGENGTT
jgi:tetratricopeptide (TPR) repeat protein